MARVGVVGDLHAPGIHRKYLEFCEKLFLDHEVDRVILIGDVADEHCASRHVRDPKAPGGRDEYTMACEQLAEWYQRFPRATVIVGNHDRRHHKRAAEAGVPEDFLKSFNDLWKTPRWKWVDEVEIDGVLYVHGDELRSGKHPAARLSEKLGRSVVCGHFHAQAGVTWMNRRGTMMFGMDVGCGCDPKHPLFAYGSKYVDKPILSAGVVIKGQPFLVPMGV